MYTQAVEVLVPRWWAWPELKLVAPQEAAEAAAAAAAAEREEEKAAAEAEREVAEREREAVAEETPRQKLNGSSHHAAHRNGDSPPPGIALLPDGLPPPAEPASAAEPSAEPSAAPSAAAPAAAGAPSAAAGAEAPAADALDDLSWQIAAIMRQRRWRTVPPPLPEEALGSSPQAAPRRRRLPLRPSGSTPRTASGCTPATPHSSPSR